MNFLLPENLISIILALMTLGSGYFTLLLAFYLNDKLDVFFGDRYKALDKTMLSFLLGVFCLLGSLFVVETPKKVDIGFFIEILPSYSGIFISSLIFVSLIISLHEK